MRITLISPRIAIQKGDFLGSGIPYWPVDLAVFAAFLRERGNDVAVIDLFGASPRDLEEREDHYLQGRSFHHYLGTPEVTDAGALVIYALSSMSHEEILDIVRVLRRQRVGARVAVLENSQAVTAYSISRLAGDFFQSGADALLCGEVYWNWDEIINYLQRPTERSLPLNVLVPRLPEGHIVRRRTEKDPTYPVPAWEMFDLENYWSIPYSHGPKTKRFLPILTSRGCPYPCDFCVVPETNNTRWRGRTPEEVVDEIITLRDRFCVRDFQVEDLNPTVSAPRWERICRLLIERDAGIFFYFVSGTKAETIKLDQVPLYARAGCRYISISPESGSPAVLRAMGKPFDHEHGLALISACRQYGIYTQACILVGHPAETPEDHRLSCDYLRALVRAGLDEVAVFVVAPLAGSALHSQKRIDVASAEALTSFSPRGRRDWSDLSRRRKELISIFFGEKLKRGVDLWLQVGRALLGFPRTKMENLPRRICFVYWLLLRYHARQALAWRRQRMRTPSRST